MQSHSSRKTVEDLSDIAGGAEGGAEGGAQGGAEGGADGEGAEGAHRARAPLCAEGHDACARAPTRPPRGQPTAGAYSPPPKPPGWTLFSAPGVL